MTLPVNERVRIWAFGAAGYRLKFLWRGRYHKLRTIEGFDRRFTQSPVGRTETRQYQLRTEEGLLCVLSHPETLAA